MKSLINAVSVCLLLLFLGAITSAQAQVSLTATGGTLTGTYTTVGAAFTAINAGTHTGTITLDITANCNEGTTPAALNASGSGAASYTSVTLRPTVTATISGNPVANRGVIELNGADNVNIDGDIVGGAVTKDLTIQNTNLSTINNTAVIRLVGSATVGNCRNNTIQNCNIKGNLNSTSFTTSSYITGIYAANGATTPTISNTTTSGLDYDKLTITNNTITNAYSGITVRSSSSTTGVCDSLTITNNIIGSNTNTDYVVFRGMHLENIAVGNISNNTVFNIRLLPAVGTSNAGIDLLGSGTTNIIVNSNMIYGVASPSTGGWGAYGINMASGAGFVVVNNVIYDITTTHYSSTTTTFNAFGIRITSGTLYKIYYNSINMYGDYATVTATASASAALLVTSTTVTADIKNNIFNNKMTASGSTATTKRYMAVWFPSTYNFTNATLNNNSYNIISDPDHFVGKIGTTVGTTEYATLGAWQPISQVNQPTNDNASVPISNAVAPFTADNDLTIPTNTVTAIESGGVIIPLLGTNVDYLAFTRPKSGTNPNTAPDMGAYEFDGLAGLPNDVGVLALTAPLTIGCYGASENVTVTIRNYGTATLPAGTNVPVSVNVTGAVTQTLNGTYTVGGAGLAPLTNASFTLPTTLNMTTIGTYTFNANTAMTSPVDGNSGNNAMSATNRTVAGSVAVPYTEDFNAVVGNIIPAGWTADNGSTYDFLVTNATAEHGTSATRGLAVNLYSGNPSSFAILPKMGLFTAAGNFSFDYRITNYSGYLNPGGTATTLAAGDSLYVQYSIDCGATYTTIPTSVITSANHIVANTFVNKAFTLPASVIGNNVIFQYIAKWGAGDYYIDIDNINITNCPTIAAPSNTTLPANLTICSGNSTTLTATGTGTMTWYDVPTGGTALGTGSPYTTPVLTAKDTFYVADVQGACFSTRTMVIVNVNPIPTAPSNTTLPANLTICSGNSTTLTATGTGTLTWYDVPTGGTALGTGSPYTTPVLTAKDTFYVDATASSCSSTRTMVIVDVNPIPTAPSNTTTSTNMTICSGNTTSLSATGTGTLTWYDVSTGGTALGTGSPYTTPVLTATDTFFVDATASSCSSTRTMVIVTVNPKPNVTFTIPAAQDTVCSNDVAFSLTGGSPVAGTYSGTGVSAGMFDPSVAGVGSFTIKYKFTNGFGCADSANSTIVVKLCTGINTTLAQGYYLGQNYPNPTQGNAQIEVRTPKTEQVVVTLMSLEGKIVETLLDESMSGTKMITVNTENIPAGIYIYRMQAGSFVQTKRLTIIK